jgi:predicted PurR-regulated permease PerM
MALLNDNKRKLGAQIFLLLFASFLLYALKGFINIFLGSIVIYVLFKPFMNFLTTKLKWKNSLAAVTIILLSFIIVIVPSFSLLKLFYEKISDVFITDTLKHTLEMVNVKSKSLLQVELINEENIKSLQMKSAGILADIFSQSLSVIGNIGIMYFILFYLLINYGNMEKMIIKFIPVDHENLTVLGSELEQQIFSNVLGAPVLAGIQGIVASVGYYFFGIQDFVFWGIMTGIFSIIPVIGSALIWLPAAIYLYTIDKHWQSISLIGFGFVIVSSIDNVFRFYFQKKIADVHPLITIIGVIMGLEWFGISGTIFGPLLLSYFLILLKMYREQYINY